MIHKSLHIRLLGLFLFTITNISQSMNNPFDYIPNPLDYIHPTIKEEIAKATVQQGVDFINLKKEKLGYVSELHKAQTIYQQQQIQLSKEQGELNKQQKILNEKQMILADKESINHDFNQLMQKIETMKGLMMVNPNNPEHKNTLKRLELQFQQLCQDLPELPEEEPVTKPDPDKKDETKPEKKGLIKSLTPHIALAAATTAGFLDTIADYSLTPLTSLDCFKDTFVDKHATKINRTLIAATLFTIVYKSYHLYKAYRADKNITEDDIFGDDFD